MIARWWLLVSLMPAAALAADDCSLNDGVLKSQVQAAKLPKGTKVGKLEVKDRQARQTITFSDGVEVAISVGGCAHLGISVAVRSKDTKAGLKSDAAAVMMLKTLHRLPLSKGATLRIDLFEEGLKAVKPGTSFPITLPCGDASCELQQAAGAITAAYDFAL